LYNDSNYADCLLFLCSAWAQTHPDFTGVWEMNPAKMPKARPAGAGLMRANTLLRTAANN